MNKANLDGARGGLISWLLLLSLLSLIAVAAVNPGGDDPGLIVFTTRQPPTKPKPPQKRSYAGPKKNALTKPQAELANKGAAAVGITVWRLRPSSANDAVEIRDLIQQGGGLPAQEVTPERVATDATLTEGQMVWLTIESLRTGYLYVIDRPRYADGKYGDPYLIFPTQRSGISNLVTAGQMIRIPSPNANPNFFVLERGKSREGELQVSEEIIVIVKPEPFESFKTPPADRKLLTQASVDALIEKYKANIEETDLEDGAGKVITLIEKLASKDASIRLSRDDPYPQTLYRLALKPDDPMLVRFELKVRGK
jgi:hypothetical protein